MKQEYQLAHEREEIKRGGNTEEMEEGKKVGTEEMRRKKGMEVGTRKGWRKVRRSEQKR